MNIPPLLISASGSMARWAINLILGVLLGWLLTANLLTTEQVAAVRDSPELGALLLLIGTAIATLVWSLYVKARARFRLVVALDAKPGTSPEAVKEASKNVRMRSVINPSMDAVHTASANAEAINASVKNDSNASVKNDSSKVRRRGMNDEIVSLLMASAAAVCFGVA